MTRIRTLLQSLARLTVPSAIRCVVGDSDPLLLRTIAWSMLLGIFEGVGLFLLVPAASAMINKDAVWGLPIGGWVIVFIVIALAGTFARFRAELVSYDLAIDFLRSVHRRVGEKVATAPLGWFTPSTAPMLSRSVSSELMNTGQIAAHALVPVHTAMTSVLTLTICCWVWDWRIGLMLTIAMPVFALLTRLGIKVSQHDATPTNDANLELTSRIVEFATAQPELRSAGRSDSFDELRDANDAWYRAKTRSLWWESLGLLLSGVAGQAVVVNLILLAALLLNVGAIAVPAALGFIIVSLRFMETLSLIGEAEVALASRKTQMRVLEDVFDLEPLPVPDERATLTAPGDIELVDVDFAYKVGTPVVKGLSLHAAPGTMCALVGPSGSGKTTVAMLASRFYDVDAGKVCVGGVDVRNQTTEQLMEQLSMVFQDVYLFDDTLEANIAFGNPHATPDQVREAGEIAGVGEIVRRLPDGWKTRVGEAGRKLSGGERQRVSIARALLKQAPIVLLDEATSSLDPENEANIMRAVDTLREHSTVLVIAHKLSTIATADRIYVFTHDGQIDDAGTHAELLERCERYATFWKARQDAIGWSLV